MNFPLEYPIFQILYWLVNTAGVGSLFALMAGGGSILAYALILRWISRADDDGDTFAYPTPALHHTEEETSHPG